MPRRRRNFKDTYSYKLLPVLAGQKETSRKHAEDLYVYPKLKKFPIGDEFHARLALIYVMSPTLSKYRKKVIQSVKEAYPDIAWGRWWNSHKKDHPDLKNWGDYVNGMKSNPRKGKWTMDDEYKLQSAERTYRHLAQQSGYLSGRERAEKEKALKAIYRLSAKKEKAQGKSNPRKRRNSGGGHHPYESTLTKHGFNFVRKYPLQLVYRSPNRSMHYQYKSPFAHKDYSLVVWKSTRGDWKWKGSKSASGSEYHGEGVQNLDKYLKGVLKRHGKSNPKKRSAWESPNNDPNFFPQRYLNAKDRKEYQKAQSLLWGDSLEGFASFAAQPLSSRQYEAAQRKLSKLQKKAIAGWREGKKPFYNNPRKRRR